MEMSYLESVLMMRQEILLLGVTILLLLYDLCASERAKKPFDTIAVLLMSAVTVIGFVPMVAGEAFGGMYVNNSMSQMVKGVLNIGAVLVFLQSCTWLNDTRVIGKRSEAYLIIMFTLLGMYLMASAGHFLVFYLGLELASLPLAVLIAYNKWSSEGMEAGAKFVLVAAFSSGMMLMGISYFYGMAGMEGLYFDNLHVYMTAEPLQLMALVFFLSGVAFKISIVPFHLWTADVYQGAPTNVSAYLSVVSKGAAVFALMFLSWKLFAQTDLWPYFQYILAALIVLTITIGNLFAMRQTNMKRFLAFSSISQAGYILLGMIGGTPMAMTSVVYYLLIYMVSNIGLFGVVSVLENASGKVKISDYDGLYKTNPYLSVIMMLFLFSLGGIPPFAGFFSKFFVFMSAAADGWYVLDFIALINTVISLYYYLLVVKAMFIKENDTPLVPVATDGSSKVGLFICLVGTLLLGLVSCGYNYIETLAF